MLKKQDALKIFSVALLLAIFGLLGESMAFSGFSAETIYLFKGLLGGLNLGLAINEGTIEFNVFNAILYLLLLFGAFLFLFSKYIEIRLIRFVLSIILFQNIIFAFLSVFSISLIAQKNWGMVFIPGLIKDAIYIYLAYFSLKHLQAIREVDVEFRETEDEIYFIPNETSRVQRFLHWFIDAILFLFMFFSLVMQPAPYLLPNMDSYNEAFASMGAFVLRFSYYSFFESFFKSTPAKFLTESQVVKDDGQKLENEHILVRTACRFIPFDSLSFFGQTGWHDRFSKTLVSREIPIGVKGSRYLWLIPGLILITVLMFFGLEKYGKHQRYLESKAEHETLSASITKGLQSLSTDDIIELEKVSHYSLDPHITSSPHYIYNDPNSEYADSIPYLKIEKIEADSITATLFAMPYHYSNDLELITIERFYLKNRNTLPRLRIALNELNSAYTPIYPGIGGAHGAAKLLGSGLYYEIKSIGRLFEPHIQKKYTSSYGRSLEVTLENLGWPVQLIEIQTEEGSMKWEAESNTYLPALSLLTLKGEYKEDETYTAKLTFLDSLNRQHHYLLKGFNHEVQVERVK